MEEYSDVFSGLKNLAGVVRGYGASLPNKLEAMERVYLKQMQVYEAGELKKIRYFREAYCYKFHLANLHLEELWSLTHLGISQPTLRGLLSNIYDLHDTGDDFMLLPSMAFEGFVVQGKAFLDFYMLHACSIFRIDKTQRMSSKKFIRALGEVREEQFRAQANAVRAYFQCKVFAQGQGGVMPSNNWGELLKTLRDSLVHRDIMSPDFGSEIPLLDRLLGPWPKNEEDQGFSKVLAGCSERHASR